MAYIDDVRGDGAAERARGHAFHVVARCMDVYRVANGMARGAVVDMGDADVRADVRLIVDDVMDTVWDAYVGDVERTPG